MRDSTEPVLHVAGLCKFYGKLRALDRLDLRIGSGEFVALLGPNGAGKSTLLQILTGLFAPDGGTVEVRGHDLRRDAVPALRHIGVVFQQSTLDLELSVARNLSFHADLHGLGRGERRGRIAALLGRFGLADRAREPVRTLSGGNRRRVELARALLHEPSVLLMDEATVGLDPPSRRDLLVHIHDLVRDRRLGVLWATHLVDEAERADRVVVLSRGRAVFDDAPAALVAATGAGDFGEAFLRVLGGDAAAAP